jgi:predicted Fe-Mo cluster-binding NifX family protein
MKIAVSSSIGSPESYINEHFGRCQYFMIINSETMIYEAVLNPGAQMQNGAGPKAAAFISDKGIDVLLTGSVGDKAADALSKCGILVADGYNKSMKVKDAVDSYLLQNIHK